MNLNKIKSNLHQYIFKEVGERTQSLLHGLDWVLPSSMVSRLLVGGSSLFVARWLGASAFGEASVVLALTLWIQIPMFLGVSTAFMHFLPQSASAEKPDWISTGLCLFVFFGFLAVVIVMTGIPIWCRLFDVTPWIIENGLLWCIGFYLYSIGTSMFSALERFRARAVMEVTFAIIFPVFIFILKLNHHLTAMHYVHGLALAYALPGLAGLSWIVYGLPSFQVHKKYIHSLLSYGSLASVGSLVNALLNSPGRLVAHKYLSSSEVGILSAYQAASVQMALFVLAAGSQVFFPIASRTPDPVLLLKKINQIFKRIGVFFFLIQLLITFVLLTLLGKTYSVAWREVCIFSLGAVMTFFHGVLSWFLNSQGRRSMILANVSGIVAGCSNIFLSFVLIQRWHVFGAGVAMTLSAMIGITGCYLCAPTKRREFSQLA